MRALADFSANASVEPISPPVEQRPLSDEERKSFAELLTFMIDQDRNILEAAIKGDFDGLAEFVTLVPLQWDALLNDFGGRTAMRRYLKSVLEK